MLNACPTHINLKVYRPRKPQDSAYYRCVEDCFETFEQVYQERFERKYGFFRPYVRQVIYRYFQPILANCRVDITILILYMGWEFIGWSRLGLGAASAAAQYVVTHPQTSHNPINLDFLLDPLSKSEFLSL